MFRTSLFAFSVMLFGLSSYADDDLLETVIRQQEAYTRSIQSTSFVTNRRIETHARKDGKIWVDEVREEILTRKTKGDLSLISINGNLQKLSGESKGSSEKYSRHGVVAPAYSGSWEGGGIETLLTIAEHGNPREMPQQSVSRNAMLISSFDIFEFAYGMGQLVQSAKRLRDVVDASTNDVYQWKAEYASGGDPTQVVLTQFARNAPDDVAAQAILDTARGYIVTSFKASSRLSDGSPNRTDTWTIVPKEVAPGVWLPERLDGYVALRSDSYEERLDISEELSDIQVNQAIADDDFSWKSLGYTGDTGYRLCLDGSIASFEIRDGQLVEVSRSKPEKEGNPSNASLLYSLRRDLDNESDSDGAKDKPEETTEAPATAEKSSASTAPSASVEPSRNNIIVYTIFAFFVVGAFAGWILSRR